MGKLGARFTGPRTALMLVFGGFGAAIGAWAGAIPLINRNAEISSYDFGLYLTIATIFSIISIAVCGKLGRYVSNRAVILTSLFALAGMTLLLFTAQSAAIFVFSLIIFSTILGVLDVFMNAEASAIEEDLKKPIFTAFHGSVSLSIAIFAIVSSLVSNLISPVVTWCIVVAALALAGRWVYLYVPARPRLPEHKASLGVSKAARLPLTMMGLITGLSISVETCAMFWSAKLLEQQAPELAAITGIGIAFFGLCNAAIRFSGDHLRRNFGEFNVLLASIALSICGLIGLGLSTNFILSTISFAGLGFGVALVCPFLFNMATAFTPNNRAAGISFIASVSGLPRILAPFLFGWVATVYPLNAAFGLSAGVMAVAGVLVWMLRKQS